jgi:hypothetical protein
MNVNIPCWAPDLEGVNIEDKSENPELVRGNGFGKTFSTAGTRVTGIDK